MATPLLETALGENAPFGLLATSGSDYIGTVRPTVTDCPAYGWDNSDQAATIDLRNTYGSDFVNTWHRDLDAAAHDRIRDYLRAAWSKRGYTVEFEDDTSAFESLPATADTPSSDIYWAVWQEAADEVTADMLIASADLTEYAR